MEKTLEILGVDYIDLLYIHQPSGNYMAGYRLLLGGNPTTHHFAVTEAYHLTDGQWKLVQFSFTALVY